MTTPALIDQLDFYLYGVIQGVTESEVSGNYKKVFEFSSTQPDFHNNEGKFFTLWGKQQISNVSQKIYDAIISELTLVCNVDSGLLIILPTFVSRYHSDSANPSGTITYPTVSNSTEYFYYDISKFRINNIDLVLKDTFQITIKNNAIKTGQENGTFKSFALPRYNVDISLKALYNLDIKTILSGAKDGTLMPFNFSWGTIDTLGYLQIAGMGKCNKAVNIEHSVDGNYVNINMVHCEE